MDAPRQWIWIAAAGIVALGLGFGLGRQWPHPAGRTAAGTPRAPVAVHTPKILYYRAPMSADTSPVPKKDAMGMDYVPVYAHAAESPGEVEISAGRMQQLGVETAPVERRSLERTVRAVGTVRIDETRQTIIAPRFDGWIETLHADATGMKVRKGEPLFVFYSPQIANIEAEYPFSAASDSEATHNGTIERLQSLAVPPEEIARLRREHSVSDHITLRAPGDGTILQKEAVAGMKFAPGETLYRLVDLSRLWVIADVYEQDLAAIAVGEPATISIAAFPGKTFAGKVDFIYPQIDENTRTAKVRIALPNPAGVLRLDMYADVAINGAPRRDVLAVPTAAVLDSGERQVVLIDLGAGRFRPQAVKVGMQGGDYTEILDGLKAGDRVVTSANFLIDSESRLRAALQEFAPPGKTR